MGDPAAPAELKEKLRLAAQARSFALDAMGLPRSESYTSYAALDRPYVTLVVTACPRTSLSPHEWWFPLIGRVPYKGFFAEKDARAEEERLKSRGLDTYVAQAAAYSSLGWRADPLVSPMLGDSPGRVAETLIHELSHAAFFFKDDADFNESAAEFFGEEGAEEFLRRRFGQASAELSRLQDERRRAQLFDAKVQALHQELAALYASPKPEEEKLRLREEVFARAAKDLGLETVNNAVVLGLRRYRGDLGDLRRAFVKVGGDWRRFLDLLKSLDKRRPREGLAAYLKTSA